MTIAVTAASGHLGAAVIRALLDLDKGRPVIGLARTPARATELGVEIRPGDYADPEALKTSLAGVEALLLVSGNGAPDARIPLHRNVIAAARATGVRRIVYTSIQGADRGTAFSPVVQSNRQTESDIRDSGLDWVIGRNGIYIEPDVEYLPKYVEAGEIANCAGEGRCGYTTRPELAHAYAKLLVADGVQGRSFNLHGPLMTQAELAAHLSRVAGTPISYRSMTAEEYLADRTAELGEFMGTIIAGIYESIRDGALDRPSDYEAAAGRLHQDWDSYFRTLRP